MTKPSHRISIWTGRFCDPREEADFRRRSLAADAARATYLALVSSLLNLLLLLFDDLRTSSGDQLLALIAIRLLTCLAGVVLALSFRAWPRRSWINWGQVLLIVVNTVSFAASGQVYQDPHLPNTGFGGLVLVSLLFLPAPYDLVAAALVWLISLGLNPLWHTQLASTHVAWVSWFLALACSTVVGGLAGYSIKRLRRERHRLMADLARARRQRREARERGEQSREQARQAQADLQAVLEAAPYPLLLAQTPENRVLWANRRAGELLECRPAELAGLALSELFLRPKEFLELLRRGLEQQPARDLELELASPRGHRLPVLVSAAAIPYQGQSALLCTLHDLSRRREHHLRLDQQDELLQELLARLPSPLVVSDHQGKEIILVNRAARRLLGLEPEGAVDQEFSQLWADPEQGRRLQDRLPLDRPLGELELRLRQGEGRELKLLAEVIPGRLQGRKVLFWAFSPPGELEEQEARERESQGLASVSLLAELGRREVARARRFGRPLSLVLVELDRFADIKFKHGYSAGARMLESAGKALQDILRGVDIMGRAREGQLVLVLPETETPDAAVAAERMRQVLAKVPVAGSRSSIFFTASMGVAGLGPADQDLDQIMDRARRALKRAQRHGGNQVRLAGAEEYN